MSAATTHPSRASFSPWLMGAAVLAASLIMAVPGSSPWSAGPLATLFVLASSGLIAAAYVVAAYGIGREVMPRSSLALPLGMALMLALSHLMGIAGMLGASGTGCAAAWGPISIGIALLVRGGWNKTQAGSLRHDATPSRLWYAAVPALAAMWLAACAPPGTLWTSEARAFDVLSYHLQLPREWLELRRIQPLEHNAYSWLPSYVEAAYTHLGAMAWALSPDPFTSGDGIATPAAQVLHAMIAVIAALSIADLTKRLVTLEEKDPPMGIGPAFASVLFLATPWVIVTASLAYNEMAACLFLAGALAACLAQELTPMRRGMLVGLLVGAACGAKPTSLFMVGLPAGLLLLMRTGRASWPIVISAGTFGGTIMLAPWLARNWNACGNPVFPYFTGVFGEGHWTALELERWSRGHHESAGFARRLALLVSDRGLGHAQFLLPVSISACVIAVGLAVRRSRAVVASLGIMILLQVLAWLFIGHLQSRFLIPVLVPLTAAAGSAVSSWFPTPTKRVRAAIGLLGLLLSLAAAAPLMVDSLRHAPAPGFIVAAGVGTMTGEAFRAEYAAVSPDRRAEMEQDYFGPAQWVNLVAAPDIGRLYLLGDSTPFYFRVPTLAHTTWDPSPLGVLLRETSGDLAESVRRLAAPQPAGDGVTHVLINFGELRRLHADGWYDPSVTTDIAESLIARHGRVLREWRTPSGGVQGVLIELITPSK